ncbi:flavodoxin-like protein [Idiomarina fontislapidosi]|uniref:Flavodoxin n=1 Tax=Idiomarina fontislapidosi TaxID=263723 RepID=A0A432XPB4_9GAMM|nr:flavodoxin domain-containing protein [Idiomarina fontislapidosi]PYE30577.1 flavodoxin-like protein [Idiomarina fontislapidosi]RUO50471.1 flavodoxin [Idiomarina fontislapidosi]
MTNTIHLLVGTTSGNTEALADHVQAILESHDFNTEMHYEPTFDSLPTSGIWLIFLATHGAGDYADSMLDFYDVIAQADAPQLPDLKYAVCAIGESCYDTFCAAGRHCDDQLTNLRASRLFERLEIDMMEDDPEEKASQWIAQSIDKLRSYPQQ